MRDGRRGLRTSKVPTSCHSADTVELIGRGLRLLEIEIPTTDFPTVSGEWIGMVEFQQALVQCMFISGTGLAWSSWIPLWALEIPSTNVNAVVRREKGGVSVSYASEEEFHRAKAGKKGEGWEPLVFSCTGGCGLRSITRCPRQLDFWVDTWFRVFRCLVGGFTPGRYVT